MLQQLVLALAAGFTVMATLHLVRGVLSRRAASQIELRNAIIEEELRRQQTPTLLERARFQLREMGYKGSPLVAAALAFVGTFIMAGALRMFLPLVLAALLSIPAMLAAGALVLRRQVHKRNDAFREQLIAFFYQMAGGLRGGSGPRRAIEDNVTSVQDPLRSELKTVVTEVGAGRPLIDSITDLADRYPSQGTRALVAAIEMDAASGGVDIAPALQEAAESLQADIDLEYEARADLSETRGAFYIASTGIGAIAVMMFASSGNFGREAYLNPFGLILLTAGVLNFAIGILRGQKLVRRAGKD